MNIYTGDYVDRGSHQVELIVFLILLKIRWPKNIYMLRGNHESIGTSSEDYIKMVNSKEYTFLEMVSSTEIHL